MYRKIMSTFFVDGLKYIALTIITSYVMVHFMASLAKQNILFLPMDVDNNFISIY